MAAISYKNRVTVGLTLLMILWFLERASFMDVQNRDDFITTQAIWTLILAI